MEFYVADRLGMTVGRLRAEMSQSEFVHWSIYHQRRAQREELEQNKAKGKRIAEAKNTGGRARRGR